MVAHWTNRRLWIPAAPFSAVEGGGDGDGGGPRVSVGIG